VISLDDDGETFSLFALALLEDAFEAFELPPTPPIYNIREIQIQRKTCLV